VIALRDARAAADRGRPEEQTLGDLAAAELARHPEVASSMSSVDGAALARELDELRARMPLGATLPILKVQVDRDRRLVVLAEDDAALLMSTAAARGR